MKTRAEILARFDEIERLIAAHAKDVEQYSRDTDALIARIEAINRLGEAVEAEQNRSARRRP